MSKVNRELSPGMVIVILVIVVIVIAAIYYLGFRPHQKSGDEMFGGKQPLPGKGPGMAKPPMSQGAPMATPTPGGGGQTGQ